ncbi:MAG TPA: ATP-binding cassette domain-containing protein, partial [Segetibacter sp.]
TAIAQRRSVMSQQADLQFPLSATEIIMMGRYPHFDYKPTTKDAEICNEVIRQMELADFLNRDFLTLSGGEKQRVQFGRALAQIWETPALGCRYLFLDEPINNLDIHYQHQFLQLAKAFTTKQTVTIAILHDINLAIEYADTITFLKAGSVVSHGVPQGTITPQLIDEVFNIPVTVIEHPSSGNPLIFYNGK